MLLKVFEEAVPIPTDKKDSRSAEFGAIQKMHKL